jgi:hypothetical protein
MYMDFSTSYNNRIVGVGWRPRTVSGYCLGDSLGFYLYWGGSIPQTTRNSQPSAFLIIRFVWAILHEAGRPEADYFRGSVGRSPPVNIILKLFLGRPNNPVCTNRLCPHRPLGWEECVEYIDVLDAYNNIYIYAFRKVFEHNMRKLM